MGKSDETICKCRILALFEAQNMTLSINVELVPLLIDKDGVIRVGDTRVTFDTVISAFDEGATAEEIVQQYSSLQLADVYAAISYYLRNRTEIQAYLQKRQKQAEGIRRQNETGLNPSGIRERLLSRQLK